MLVYGDHSERADPSERLEALAVTLQAAAALPPGLERHSRLSGALVEAGRLLQGVADEGAPTEPLARFLHAIAAAVVRSWDSRFEEVGDLPSPPAVELPPQVELRLPEGFAFYAVYPEAYADAARRLRLVAPPRVIGIRSIGTSLGAVAAAALGAPPPLTVRPFGDPFAREVVLPADIEDATHFVIVDEGPGLSGSSFGAVADALERRGVPLERIAFLTSHGGDLGPRASEAHRQRWRMAQRLAAEPDLGWLADRLGPLEEITGDGPWERRKFVASTGGERLFVKFAGLGTIGERKLAMAKRLHAARFTAEPLELVHGFLVERWCEGARPLGEDERPIADIGRYIGARARMFPAEADSGASVEELLAMCRRNLGLALGDGAAAAAARWNADRLSGLVRRVRVDGKLDRHEWLRMPDGRLLKADALDHHQGHDLIGCQDAAWDLAGAAVEFDLTPGDCAALAQAAGLSPDPELLDFYRLAYCSFRLGRSLLAADLGGGGQDRDSERRYAAHLQHLLVEHA